MPALPIMPEQRPPGLCLQVGLSLLALALARQFNEQACTTPLFQDSQARGALA